jgi:DNA-binding GntR family transcriptional regulator
MIECNLGRVNPKKRARNVNFDSIACNLGIADQSQLNRDRGGAPGPEFARGSLAESVAGKLRELVITGELAAGERIGERILCERLRVSRTPLREAYKVLAAEGILLLLRNRGAIVAPLRVDQVDHAIDVLCALEGLAGERACAMVTPERLQLLRGMHGEMVRAFETGDMLAYFRMNQAIHQTIVDTAGNPILSSTYAVISRRIARFRYVGNTSAERWQRAVAEHEQILATLHERDAPLLAQLLKSHLLHGWKLVKERFAAELAAPAEAHEPRARRGRQHKQKPEPASKETR